MKGFEPPTPSLPWTCSTPELHRHIIYAIQLKRLKYFERETRLEPATLSLEGCIHFVKKLLFAILWGW